MKYLHSGYILLCEQADYAPDGRVNAKGLFDLIVVKNFPADIKCQFVVGFGTPYERRQYRGIMEVEDPTGRVAFTAEFNANDPNDLLRGHAIFPATIPTDSEGCYIIRCTLYNWRNEVVWEITRQIWAMVEGTEAQDTAAADAAEA